MHNRLSSIHLFLCSVYFDGLRRVLTRIISITNGAYKDDPTIMAWELINEPRCQEDYSGKTVQEIGMEGFYGDSTPEKKHHNPGYQVGADFIGSSLIDEIDFATTIHAYPDIWLSEQNHGSQTAFVRRWMWCHWDDAMKTLKKPLVFAEFGKSKRSPRTSVMCT
ncbi:hypothetical protein OPV22_016720 [Ensete ventricosum]|uniref:mannan endo-1,4-beta-mannosidase n=1 Tax=Ensete ventricosum TaxID=4639 RepID=A0AAV8QS86_ENSVE|nr:hypothetical protein OPV22_016720 [Ensete ventricosum]